MIYYNSNTINDWNFDESNVIKVYRNNAVVFYKLTTDSPTPTYKVCYAVVDDITQYTGTEFEDVYDKATEKWYKLNNLNQYEQYGIYGEGRNITYYEGKLTVDDGYEYEWNGSSWANLGEVSGSSSLPQGYTEVEYIENTGTSYFDIAFKPNTNTRILTEMQAVSSANYPRLFGAGMWNAAAGINLAYQSDGGTNSIHINWYGRTSWSYYTSFTFDYDKHTYDLNKNSLYRDETLVGSTSYTTSYQSTDNLGIFTYISSGRPSQSGYWGQEHFKGKMYSFKVYDNGTLVRDLVPCKRDNDNTVGAYDIVNDVFYTVPTGYTTDKLIAGAETGTTEYPKYYSEKSEPLDNLTFSTMEEAQAYAYNNCVYDGMHAKIDGDRYYFDSSDENGWVENKHSLPDVPFVLNYNAKNYKASTHTIPYTEGALNAIDAVITGTTSSIIDHHEDGYIQLTGSTSTTIRALVGTTNFSRSSSSPNITIICKAYTPGSSTEGDILSNRYESYNWMYRHKSAYLTFHGTSEQGSIAVSNTEPNTCSVRIDSNRLLKYNNWTQNTTSTYSSFNYGLNSNGGALFSGYYISSNEMWKGVFYWIYMSLNTLTDEQVQQVINYNENL